MFRCNKVNKTAIAFYSNQDTDICKGKLLTSVFKALANSIATNTAEYESLHYPISKSLGMPEVPRVPKSL